jgi:hypothetical protein
MTVHYPVNTTVGTAAGTRSALGKLRQRLRHGVFVAISEGVERPSWT